MPCWGSWPASWPCSFTLVMYGQERAWERVSAPPWLKPAVGGLVVGGFALLFPEVLGIGHVAMDRMLEGQVGLGLLLALVVMKIVATSLTLGSGGSGGVFVPSLFVGSALGGAVGTAVGRWAPFLHGGPGAYALVGMGARGGRHLPRAPHGHRHHVRADRRLRDHPPGHARVHHRHGGGFFPEGGVHLHAEAQVEGDHTAARSRGEHPSASERAGVLQTTSAPSREDALLSEVLADALGSRQTSFPLVCADGTAGGRHAGAGPAPGARGPGALESVLVAADLATAAATLHEDDNVEQALEQLTETGADLLPVVDAQDRLIGVVLAADVMERYSHELRKLRLASTLAQKRSFSVQTDGMELGHGMRLAEVDVPESLRGRTIREAELRARHAVEVLYVLKGPYRIRKLADPDLILDAGDRMLIMAEASSLQAFRENVGEQLAQPSLERR